MESFTLRDFSGGLNTATDEANLPANMTASLLNVDLLQSGAFSRRNGYKSVTPAALSLSPVSAISRYYKKNGSKYTLAVCGANLYYSTYEIAAQRLEAENATITG